MNFRSFQETLQKYPAESVVFVGLGNSMRSDDAAGLILLQKLKQSKYFQDARFIEACTNPENYLQAILDHHPQAVIFVDAARFNQPPGTIQWLTKQDLEQIRISTHAFSVSLIEDYIRAHHPADFYYLGIQSESTAVGTTLSHAVQKNLDQFISQPEVSASG